MTQTSLTCAGVQDALLLFASLSLYKKDKPT